MKRTRDSTESLPDLNALPNKRRQPSSSSSKAHHYRVNDLDPPCQADDSEADAFPEPSSPPDSYLIPLTEENLAAFSMSQASKSQGERAKTIHYDDPKYTVALETRRVAFNSTRTKPSNWDAITTVLKAQRSSPTLDEANVETLHTVTEDAQNEATITNGVIPDIVKLKQLLSGSKTKAIPQAQWHDVPLRTQLPTAYRIAPPSPDLTIGYNRQNLLQYSTALEKLSHTAAPVVCQPSILYPCFALEAKGLKDEDGSRKQNLHNGAVMLRNLRHLRLVAGTDEAVLQSEFDGKAWVFTVAFTKHFAELRCHWSQTVDGELAYHFRVVGVWGLGDPDSWALVTRHIRNAIDTAMDLNRQPIDQHLKGLQDSLVSPTHPLSPPSSSSHATKRSKATPATLPPD